VNKLLVLLFLLVSVPAQALNILLTNDDGFETANIQALFNALQVAGHDVILVAPFVNQSGTSGSVDFLEPILPTSESSEGGLIGPGAFGIGPTTIAPNQFYADSTPVGAVLYGIDVLAEQIWHDAPDLVLSGPNEGNNLGTTTVNSGTVGAAVVALNRGIPAIALSAANGDTAEVVAALAVELVEALVRRGRVVLPPGTGLNVNFPAVAEGQTAGDFDFAFTRIGSSSNIAPAFYENLGDSPLAQLFGIPADLFLPGVSINAQDDSLAASLGLPPGVIPVQPVGPPDNRPRSESNAIQTGAVTVSVIQGTYSADLARQLAVKLRLKELFK
jgi:5'-nucleotidase